MEMGATKKMLNCSRNVVFMDATYSVNQYGYLLYTLCVCEESFRIYRELMHRRLQGGRHLLLNIIKLT